MHFSEKRHEYKVYDGKKEPKLGMEGNPALVSVKTKAREKEVAAVLKKNGWIGVISVDPDKPEDISALKRLEKPPKPVTVEHAPGRNDPCPCGSGKKYKKCHGA